MPEIYAQTHDWMNNWPVAWTPRSAAYRRGFQTGFRGLHRKPTSLSCPFSAKTEAIFASDVFDAVRGRLRNTVKSGPKAGEGVSMAYPLLVNNLLVKALNTAAELGAERVDGALVRGC